MKKRLRINIINYFSSLPENELNDEHREVLKYLESNPVRIFPYSFHTNYSSDKIEVMSDPEKALKYVMQDGKRLYFKRRWGKKRIQRAYADLLREQDTNSPHRYLTDSFTIGEDEIIADIGAAEGNFSLSVVEKVKKIYLFENDSEWIEAQKATFAPWPGKVEIINKLVSGVSDESHITLDDFYEQEKGLSFIKIDVDGAESIVLNSCSRIFNSGAGFKVALCTYHRKNDENDFTLLLKDHGFSVSPSKGYMIYYYDRKMESPYLRRGLIRASR